MIAALAFAACVVIGSLDFHPVGDLTAAKMWAADRIGIVQWRCLDAIVTRESGWRLTAVNRWSGAFGLFQAYPASKLDRYGRDPMGQMRFGLAYMAARYGSACGAWAFWQRHHWY